MFKFCTCIDSLVHVKQFLYGILFFFICLDFDLLRGARCNLVAGLLEEVVPAFFGVVDTQGPESWLLVLLPNRLSGCRLLENLLRCGVNLSFLILAWLLLDTIVSNLVWTI